ncbi:hypothetical protein KW842_09740 [Duganella sp. sic0402]|nr:hypothetical protein [Duganella sp. sic0402]
MVGVHSTRVKSGYARNYLFPG